MKARQLIKAIRQKFRIHQVSAKTFYFYVINAEKDWYAAYCPTLKTIYLKNRQPNSVLIHEAIHALRDKEIEGTDIVYEELVTYLTTAKICQITGIKESRIHTYCRTVWYDRYAYKYDISQLEIEAYGMAAKMIELASK